MSAVDIFAILTLSFLAVTFVVLTHAVVFLSAASWHWKRVELRDYDRPRPWYVRYAAWLDRKDGAR